MKQLERQVLSIQVLVKNARKYNDIHAENGQFGFAGGSGGGGGSGGTAPAKKPHTVISNAIPTTSDNYMEGVNDPHIIALADTVSKGALAHDGPVTADMKETVAKADNGGTLQGLDFRIKSNASMRRKIVSDSQEKMVSPEEAAAQINDSLRYTTVVPADDGKYTRATQGHLDALREKGYTVSKLKNTWESNGYKGINTVMKTPDGQSLELQFHTPQSFATKEAAHIMYNDARRMDWASPEAKALQQKMNTMFGAVIVPTGAGTIK